MGAPRAWNPPASASMNPPNLRSKSAPQGPDCPCPIAAGEVPPQIWSRRRLCCGGMAKPGGGARGGGRAGDVAAGAYRPGCLLVTGGAGFIASHVVARLLERYPDYRVRALPFPLPPPPPLYLLYHLAGHPAAAPATTSSRPVRYAPI